MTLTYIILLIRRLDSDQKESYQQCCWSCNYRAMFCKKSKVALFEYLRKVLNFISNIK